MYIYVCIVFTPEYAQLHVQIHMNIYNSNRTLCRMVNFRFILQRNIEPVRKLWQRCCMRTLTRRARLVSSYDGCQFVHICIYIYVNIYQNIYRYSFLLICMYILIHICIFICICICICMYIYIHICKHIYMYIYE